jgi:energy-coupling factor transporter ATP-binding protein EcfA2
VAGRFGNNARTTEETMVERTYTASLSKSQGREGWSIIFRHPVRLDPATGKPGRRVRRGLGTRDPKEANRLVVEMNQLLSDQEFWEVSARSRAEARFDGRVVDIFYDGLVPDVADFFELRSAAIPLPSSADSEYRRVMLVGTTGSGKTTLARQLLGTDPKTERFPSISTAKTTVADMEIVLADGAYKAVVTFLPRDEVLDYIEECISAAVLSAYYKRSDAEILRRLLNHVSQRFRLNYLLGNGGEPIPESDLDDDEEGMPADGASTAKPAHLEGTNALLKDIVARVRRIADRYGTSLRDELSASETDERVIEEIFEENLDHLLREDEEFHWIADQLMDEIERRFELLADGELGKTKQGWPRLWGWATDDRAAFIKTVSRFSSNYAPYFGTLLTPLVNGIRVAGPFKPAWLANRPALVLFDGEGLGHTPESSTSLPTPVTRRFEEADVVLLVDNATQPMQAAAVAVMHHIAASGSTSKLMTCFTHFDAVTGDNLPTFQAKEQHVIASVENVLPTIGQQLGPFAERALRKRVQAGCFFVGGIPQRIDQTKKSGVRTIAQLNALLDAIETSVKRPEPVKARPVYDRMNLVLAVRAATETFHDAWSARLGQGFRPDIPKSHWATVKALSRRLAEGWADEWANLRPVADLHKELESKIYLFIQNPIGWDPAPRNDDDKQQVYDEFASTVSSRALDIAARRIRGDRVRAWQEAYSQRGQGSTFVRASIIKEQVYDKAAPIPGITPSPGRNKFLREVMEAVTDAALKCDIELR